MNTQTTGADRRAQYVVVEMRTDAPHAIHGPFADESAAYAWAEQECIGTGSVDWFDVLPIESASSSDAGVSK